MASEADREKKRRERKRLVGFKHKGIVPIHRAPDLETLRQRYAEIPQYDTRSLTGMICGDPLPGRSALDQRLGA